MAPHANETSSNSNGHDATPQLQSPHRPSQKASTKGGPKILPPGCSEENFTSFLDAARKLVEDDNVFLIELDHNLIDGDYMQPCKGHDMHAIVDREYFVASATVSPRDVPEVQELMRLCNKHEIPVWPFSIGRVSAFLFPQFNSASRWSREISFEDIAD